MGAVSSGRIRRPGGAPGFRHVLHVARVLPERNSHSLSTSVPTPFFFSCCPGGRGTASPGTRPTSARSGTQLLWFHRPCFSSCGNCRPGRPLLFTSQCPLLCLQLDVFSISLNVPCAERVPPTWLAPRLDRGPSSLLPRGTSFGRSVQPRPPYFRRGRRTDLSARGSLLSAPGTSIPEVPGRVLSPDSSKRLHIHAVPSSCMPARPSLDMSPDDPRALLRAACPV